MSAYQQSQEHAMILSAAASDVDIARRSVSIGPERTKSLSEISERSKLPRGIAIRHVSRATRFFPDAWAPETSCFARARTRAHLARAHTRPRSVHRRFRTLSRSRASPRRSSRDFRAHAELFFFAI